MKLPLLISIPHAGLQIPAALKKNCLLLPEQVVRDGDEEAAEIYNIADQAAAFVTTDVARAILDMNRAEDDRRRDGVVKTHTCWNEPIYQKPLTEQQIEFLLHTYYRPYHQTLSDLAKNNVKLGVDCHTMATVGPPVGPDPGQKRPAVCLSNKSGTCPDDWINYLADCISCQFGREVMINQPFQGGYIIDSHCREVPWIQIEISRTHDYSPAVKKTFFLKALKTFCENVF